MGNDPLRVSLGLATVAELAKALQFQTVEAFTAWCAEHNSPPPSLVIDGREYYPYMIMYEWFVAEYRRQHTHTPLNTPFPPPSPKEEDINNAKPHVVVQEFIPPPQQRDYSKERLPPMDPKHNKYEAAREEKERQAREQNN